MAIQDKGKGKGKGKSKGKSKDESKSKSKSKSQSKSKSKGKGKSETQPEPAKDTEEIRVQNTKLMRRLEVLGATSGFFGVLGMAAFGYILHFGGASIG